jgi:hypothetical protein
MAGREYQFRERDGEEYGCRIVSGRRHLKSGRRDREHGIFVDHRRRARGATRELGELNHVVAWWQYESLADRERRREHMMADPRWQEYLRMTNGMLDVQNPASSNPLPSRRSGRADGAPARTPGWRCRARGAD